MTIKEEKMNLFNAPRGYYLAHCITGDYSLGAGVAKQVDEIYNMKKKLNIIYPYSSVIPLPEDTEFFIGSALLVDEVFNLVTKKHSGKKAKYKKLRSALNDMRDQMKELMITKIAMPKLGCGHDKLDWDKVREIIEEVFEDTDVEILVCSL